MTKQNTPKPVAEQKAEPKQPSKVVFVATSEHYAVAIRAAGKVFKPTKVGNHWQWEVDKAEAESFANHLYVVHGKIKQEK